MLYIGAVESFAQERLDITIRIPSISDSSRFSIHVLDLGNVFYVDETIPIKGLHVNRAVRGRYPKIQIIDKTTDSVYVVLLEQHKGDIVFQKDTDSEKLHVDVSQGLLVLGENSIFKDFFMNRRNNPNISEIKNLLQLKREDIEKSDSLKNRLSNLLKLQYEDEIQFLKNFGDDYVSFDLFKDQVLVFKSFLESDSSFIEGYKRDMHSVFSSKIQSTPEFKSTYENLTSKLESKDIESISMSTVFEDISLARFKLSDIKSKYILIDFWATWCPPCVQMVPYIKELRQDFNHSDLEIIGVSADHNIKNLNKGIVAYQMNWKHVYDELGDIANDFGVTAYPTMFLIDQKGKVLWKGEGFSKNKLDKVREIIAGK